MEQIFFSTIIFSTCFLFLSLGVLLNGKPLQGSCGRRKSDLLPGEESDIECLCETTGSQNACAGISEDELVQAMLRVKNDSVDIQKVTDKIDQNIC